MLGYAAVLLILFLGRVLEGKITVRSNEFGSEGDSLDTQPEHVPTNQKELVEELQQNGYIKSDEIVNIMLQVDRKHYVKLEPYEDFSQFTEGLVMDAAPKLRATMLEALKNHLKPGSKVLEVAFGNGYGTTCLALMVGETGHITGVEWKAGAITDAEKKMKKDPVLKSKRINVTLLSGNVSLVAESRGPFDAIFAPYAPKDPPKELLKHLKVGGRMAVAEGVSGRMNSITVYDMLPNRTVTMAHIPAKIHVHREKWW